MKQALRISLNFSGYIVLFLILIFPFVNFKISLSSVVFPALDIIIIYYLISYHKFGEGKIMAFSLFIDQLIYMPLGCSMLAYIFGNMFLRFAGRGFILKEYVSNFLIFCCYCFLIFLVRYLILVSQGQFFPLFELIFQYLITIFSYPLFRGAIYKLLTLLRFET